MSHFAVMVIGEDHKKQLAKFDENLEIPRYVKYTRQQLIDNKRNEIEDYKNGTYATYLKDKEFYKSTCGNQRHINYLEHEFPKKLNFSDEQLYKEAVKDYKSEDIGEEGEIYSTYNPESKWDWYVVGGRFAGLLKLKDEVKATPPNFSYGWNEGEKQKVMSENRSDIAKKGDVSNINDIVCFALLKDGIWFERGKMGWWALVTNEKNKDVWESEFKKLTNALPENTLITIVDCHI